MTAQTVNPFADLVGRKTKTRLMVEVVADELARRFGVAYVDVMGHGRHAPIVEARHWAWWLLVRRFGQSQMGVGRAAGWDASTVWHAVHKIDRRVRRGEIPDAIFDLVTDSARSRVPTWGSAGATGGPSLSRQPSQPPRTLGAL